MIIPYRIDAVVEHRPIANYALLASLAAAYALQLNADGASIAPFVNTGFSPVGMIGHMWLHGGPMHLFGNMLFLALFGNAVCGKFGNLKYLALYLACGLGATAIHNVLDGRPSIGASGAITGIIGLYLVFFPINRISCFYIIYLKPGYFTCRSFWMILYWLGWDIIGALLGGGNVAHFAHLGGMATGFGLGMVLITTGLATMEWWEESILQALGLVERTSRQRPVPQVHPVVAASSSYGVVAPAAVPGYAPRRHSDITPRAKTINVPCSCGHVVKVPSRLAGYATRCTSCQQVLTIPSASEAVARDVTRRVRRADRSKSTGHRAKRVRFTEAVRQPSVRGRASSA